MLQSLSSNRRKILALGVLLILLLLFAVVLVEPYIVAYKASVERADKLAFQIKQAKKAINKQEYYLQEIDRLGQAYSEEDIYLRSERIALASAEIQQIITSIAKTSGADLLSSQPIIDEKAKQGRVGLEIRARANIFGLRKLLHGVETRTPRLFITDITINRGSRAVFRFNNTESSSQTLDIGIQIFGYMKKGETDQS